MTTSSDEDSSLRKESQFDHDTENDDISIYSSPYNPRRISTYSRKRTQNTGPKGVRADARAYEASKRDALKKAAGLSQTGTSVEESSEDEWMSRWRERRMKELSKRGVAGVNFFGQVDDVDAMGYLKAVDVEEDEDEVSRKRDARRNVITVVLIYDNVCTP
jgi:hypothetical protein